MDLATSYRQLSKATGYSLSTLHGMRAKGQIPERGPDGWRIADVLAAMERNTDPGRRSERRSAPNVRPNTERPKSDPMPEPADYRARTDLPDDFARGVLYATHALAYSMPTHLASTMMEQGADAERALAVYRESRADASLVVADPLAAVGLVAEDADDCGPYAPTLFCGFDPSTFFGAAR
ncbi:hypothetical protein [Methylobacterium sp. J-090]|uniref:hypothetical protein n=1 Tax=Methylobacterium sp. J-090 TaxID=2836666 RepID=UPI001FBB355D|nr:hypothetical protein [Methylobacterium sp. J-090]MCJ2084312.1 hypothetical protein [Methylobacterium sp. J-090]